MNKTLKALEKSLEYKNLVDLQAVHAEATRQIAEITTRVQESYLEIVDGVRDEYALAQSAITETEAALEIIARKHPEWFSEKRSVKTPYGVVKFHKSTSLQIDSEELTILLIKSEFIEPDLYIVESEKLNLEALEDVPDEELKRIRVTRIVTDNFSVKAATIDLGKAVKKAEEKAEKKEAA
jgi:ribosomal protein L31